MPRFADVVTIEVKPGRRDQTLKSLLAHKARLTDEPGTLQFEVLIPQNDDKRILVFELFRDEGAFQTHLNGPSLVRWREETAGMAELHATRCTVAE